VLTQRSPLLRIFAQAFGARRPLQFFEPRPEPIGKSFLRQRAGAEFSPCVNQFGIRRC
jgi:hypothetical protein